MSILWNKTLENKMAVRIRGMSKNKIRRLADLSVDEFFSGEVDLKTNHDNASTLVSPHSVKKCGDISDLKGSKRKNHAKIELAAKGHNKERKLARSTRSVRQPLMTVDPESCKYSEEEDEELSKFDEEDAELMEAGGSDDDPVTDTEDQRRQTEAKELECEKAFEAEILAMSSGSDDSGEEGDAKYFKPPDTPLSEGSESDQEEDACARININEEDGHVASSDRPLVTIATVTQLSNELQVVLQMTEPDNIDTVLKHIGRLIVCYAHFPKVSFVLCKKLVSYWSKGIEESTRVLAFILQYKMLRLRPDMWEVIIKDMQTAYVRNCSFVNPSSLPLIHLMQRTLVEVYLVREDLAYQSVFLYIRQMAIHLRNAIREKSEKNRCAVYNWQYVMSLRLWSNLLSESHPHTTLQPLIYPLTQVIIGTIRLLPNARHHPLRFFCVRCLMDLSTGTDTYIPIIPLLLEVFDMTDFNKKPKLSIIKSLPIDTMLKFTKPQLEEKAFKEAVIGRLCELLLEYLHSQSHLLSFPELVVPMMIQLKEFMKKCKVAVLTHQVKQVTDKVEETVRVLEKRRSSITFSLADVKAVEAWEADSKEKGTPMTTFYRSWKKLHERQLAESGSKLEMTKAERAASAAMKARLKVPPRAPSDDRKEFPDLFDLGSGDESDVSFTLLSDPTRMKRPHSDSDDLVSSEDYSDHEGGGLHQPSERACEDAIRCDGRSRGSITVVTDIDQPDVKLCPPRATVRELPVSKLPKLCPNEAGDVVEDFSVSDFR